MTLIFCRVSHTASQMPAQQMLHNAHFNLFATQDTTTNTLTFPQLALSEVCTKVNLSNIFVIPYSQGTHLPTKRGK